MKAITLVDQKLVMAHVYGHCDFFKNNVWFSRTDRQMIDTMANHASRIRRYIDRYGLEEVEAFLDRCLSSRDLIDVHSASSSSTQPTTIERRAAPEPRRPARALPSQVLHGQFHQRQRRRAGGKRRGAHRKRRSDAAKHFPERPSATYCSSSSTTPP